MIYTLYIGMSATLLIFTHGILCADLILLVQRLFGPIPAAVKLVAWIFLFLLLYPLTRLAYLTVYDILGWMRGVYFVT